MPQFQNKPPANFDANNPEFAVFKDKFDDYRDAKVSKLTNVRIANNSVVFNYFKIFKESCIGEEVYQHYQKNHKFFLKFIFPKINFKRNKRFIVITDEWTTNYYHWHLIALHRLLVLKENNLIEGSILFLPIKYKKISFVWDSLEKFGIKKDQIFYLRRKSNIKVKEVYLVDCYQNHPESFFKIKAILNNSSILNSSNLNLGERIYISRTKSPIRNIINEAEFTEVISKYGFKKVLMENYSYADQVAISQNAKYIIGPHGAGLTNILFMKNGGSLLELSGKPEVAKPVTDYYKLANMTGINYFYQECRSDDTRFHFGNMIVDMEKLEKNLQLMLAH